MSQKTYWKSSEHKKSMASGDAALGEEFTNSDGVLKDPVERRDFLKVMGASLALAGVTACAPIRRPVEQITPYAEAPEGLVPGRPTYFSTSMQIGFDVVGLLVESHEGRPTKIEGNPKHPQSLGATSAIHQASVLELYDPDRLQHAVRGGKKISPVELENALSEIRKKYLAAGGKGLAFLSSDVVSPSLARAFETLKSNFPGASFHRFEAVNADSVLEGSRLVSGKNLIPTHRLENADIVVSFDSDFLANEPGSVASARAFAGRRDPDNKNGMNRLYVFEPQFSVTGGMADHRVRVKPSRVAASLAKLAIELSKKQGGLLPGDVLASLSELAKKTSSETSKDSTEDKVISALADDLLRSKGRSILLVGRGQGSHVHALVMALNQTLGNEGRTVFYRETPDNHPGTEEGSIASVKSLISKIDKGAIETLFILGGNPVYNTPADLSFSDKLKRVGEVVHLTLAENETSELAKTLIPESHFLESWGDARSLSGATGLIQPLITPLYESLSCLETILKLSGSSE
ncbi:MAG: TAT-variant-translocated molybdopterin oxidoreductase, partial [Spirochaetia bacterium]|nr:TAT-variant-translocated molybdopterin oxidoreductase [Spirochaetia bacterium]